MPDESTPTTRLIVIERTPWFSSGLRREWKGLPHTVLFRDRYDPQDFSADHRRQSVLVDLDTLPGEGLKAIDRLTNSRRMPVDFLVVVLNSGQRNRAAELLSLGVVCYFVKPVPVFEVARSCQRLLESEESSVGEH
ncbi:hypothetical protein [Rubinisphaera margarita]|uniref:hypothetical protein n=1 Tax=Rubinisphaera margarita TaxID=2909586 RepID=UPI001EE7A987|nr:hypothetical protein [Rubinisphaera margarita]MCG6156996.1 hypothetical protein [Rubinisphaera margarita]